MADYPFMTGCLPPSTTDIEFNGINVEVPLPDGTVTEPPAMIQIVIKDDGCEDTVRLNLEKAMFIDRPCFVKWSQEQVLDLSNRIRLLYPQWKI